MAEDAGRDRREFERFEARIRVKLKFDNVKNLRQFYTKDISQGGLFIVAEKPKPVGTHVEIVIYPPGVPLGFPLQGTVVHVVDAAAAKSRGTPPGMGIRFVDLTPDKVASIKAYIDSMGEIEREETVVAAAPAKQEDTRPVELRLDTRDQLKKLYVQDLSKGSLFLRTREVRPVGSSISVHLIVEGMARGLWLGATVVRVVVSAEKGKDTSGMGLELGDFSAEKREAIVDYLAGRNADIAVEDEGAVAQQKEAAGPAPGAGGVVETPTSGPSEIEPEPLPVPNDADYAGEAPTAAGADAGAPMPAGAKDKKDKRPAIANADQLESIVKEFENASVSKSYFDQLSLPANALLDEIKTAYLQLVRRFHPDPWQGKVTPEMLERLQKVQMHLRTVYDTLSHPQKRASYEVSNGIEADGGDPILQQAREKKRSEYRAAFARKFGDHISKGERLIEAAMEDIRAGKTKSALSNIRLALSFDPLNEKYRKLLKTVLDKGGKA